MRETLQVIKASELFIMNLKLTQILKRLLVEVGDLVSTKPYSYIRVSKTEYKFEDKDQDNVQVSFNLFTDELNQTLPQVLQSKLGYNLGFDIKGITTQAKQIPFSDYNRILKTVVEITTRFMEEVQPDFIFTKGTSKGMEDIESATIKDYYYLSVMKHNTPPGYGYSTQDLGPYKGAILRKLNK